MHTQENPSSSFEIHEGNQCLSFLTTRIGYCVHLQNDTMGRGESLWLWASIIYPPSPGWMWIWHQARPLSLVLKRPCPFRITQVLQMEESYGFVVKIGLFRYPCRGIFSMLNMSRRSWIIDLYVRKEKTAIRPIFRQKIAICSWAIRFGAFCFDSVLGRKVQDHVNHLKHHYRHKTSKGTQKMAKVSLFLNNF